MITSNIMSILNLYFVSIIILIFSIQLLNMNYCYV